MGFGGGGDWWYCRWRKIRRWVNGWDLLVKGDSGVPPIAERS